MSRPMVSSVLGDTARLSGAGASPDGHPDAESAGEQDAAGGNFGLLDWLFAGAVVQTIVFNPTIGEQGDLTVYVSALTWPAVAAGALIKWTYSKDRRLLVALGALAAATLIVFALLLAHVGVRGFDPSAVSGLLRLAYIPIGALAALTVYRQIPRHLDLALVALAGNDVLLLVDLLRGPIDLAHRLNPLGLGGFNVFATFSAVLIVLRVSSWLLRRRRPSLLVGASLVLCSLTILPTFSRSGFLALAGGLGLAATLRAEDKRRNWLVTSIILLLMAAIPLVAGEPITARITQINLSAASGRLEIWQMAWEGIKQRPILGNGFGSFLAYSQYAFMDGRNYTSSTHNVALQLLYELGAVGMILVLLGVWLVLRRCWSVLILPATAALVMDSAFSTFPQVIQVSWILGMIASIGLWDRMHMGLRRAAAAQGEDLNR